MGVNFGWALILIALVWLVGCVSEPNNNPLEYSFVFTITQGVGGRAYFFTDIPTVEQDKPLSNLEVFAIPIQYNRKSNSNYPDFDPKLNMRELAKAVSKTDEKGFYQIELPIGEYFIILDNKWCNNQGGCRIKVESSKVVKHNIIIGGG